MRGQPKTGILLGCASFCFTKHGVDILSFPQAQDTAKREYDDVLQSLQSRVTELQENCHRQEERHKHLTHELHTLQAAATAKNNFKHPSPPHHPSSKVTSSHNHPHTTCQPQIQGMSHFLIIMSLVLSGGTYREH